MSIELLSAVIRLGIVVISEELQKILSLKLKRKKRKCWVRKWICRRPTLGASLTLFEELAVEHEKTYMNMLRMTREQFEVLLGMVSAKIQKQDTHMRAALSPKLKLHIVLRYLATGDSLASLQYFFRVPKCTISIFLPEVLDIIYEVLKDFIKTPNTIEEWCEIEKGFAERWNFPGCVGSLDGKHVVIKKPKHSGLLYYNYKGSYSIVLMALVDSEYIFRYIDIGALGRTSDGGIFQHCSLKKAIDEKSLNLPEIFFFVGAFPLKPYLLKPYSRNDSLNEIKLVFNYRLSRARRIVENAFGILASRFQIFVKPITLEPNKVDKVIFAAVSLHNWLQMTSKSQYITPGPIDIDYVENGRVIPGHWTQELQEVFGLSRQGNNNYPESASNLRDKLAAYFMGKGAVPWQMAMIR